MWVTPGVPGPLKYPLSKVAHFLKRCRPDWDVFQPSEGLKPLEIHFV